jgi:hypothetical protein
MPTRHGVRRSFGRGWIVIFLLASGHYGSLVGYRWQANRSMVSVVTLVIPILLGPGVGMRCLSRSGSSTTRITFARHADHHPRLAIAGNVTERGRRGGRAFQGIKLLGEPATYSLFAGFVAARRNAVAVASGESRIASSRIVPTSRCVRMTAKKPADKTNM